MVIQEILDRFRTPCICGRQHTLVTDTVYIGDNASAAMKDYLAAHLSGRGVIIADENTYPCAGRALAEALSGMETLIVPGNAHATEIVCADVEDRLNAMETAPAYLIACGSGSLHDITRYVACGRGIPFVSYPTAASVDGFVSGVAAMTIRGTKITYPSAAPAALFADPAVFSAAPERLTASGVGDLLGKYICLADWRISHVLTGEYICPALEELEYSVLAAVKEAADVLESSGGSPACRKDYTCRVMEGLVLSGLAIQLAGNSRPASGSEHHLSHFWEMGRITKEVPALHGEQVGIAALLMLKRYKEERTAFAKPFVYAPEKVFSRELLSPVYRELLDDIMKENLPDGTYDSSSLAKIPADALTVHADEVRKIIDALPSHDELYALMKRCGCKTALSEIGLPDDAAFLETTCRFAPYVRCRLTFLKLLESQALL